MPFVNQEDTAPAPTDAFFRDPTEPAPGFGEPLYAMLKSTSLTRDAWTGASTMLERTGGGHDPNFDPFAHMAGYEDAADYLQNAQNGDEMNYRKSVVDEDRRLAKIAQFGDWKTKTAAVIGGAIDPITIPLLFTPLPEIRAGMALRGMAKMGATMGALAGAEEPIRQLTEPYRTPMDAVYGVSGAALIGGLVGGGMAKYFGHMQANQIVRGVEEDALGAPIVTSKGTLRLNDFPTALKDMKDELAAAADPESAAKLTRIGEYEADHFNPEQIVRSFDDGKLPADIVPYSEAEKAAMNGAHEEQQQAVDTLMGAADSSVGAMRASDDLVLANAKVVRPLIGITPVGRLARATVDEMRSLGMKVYQNSFRFVSRKTGLPGATPNSAGTLAQIRLHAAMNRARPVLTEQWSKYNKRMRATGGKTISKSEFRQIADMAARRGDTSAHPEIAATAQAFRQHVYEPTFREGVKERLFDPHIRAIAAREAAEPYGVYLRQRKSLHKQLRATIKQSARDAKKLITQGRAADLQGMQALEARHISAVERLYDDRISGIQEQAADDLATRLNVADEADKTARQEVIDSNRAQFDPLIAEANAAKKAHVESVRTLYKTHLQKNIEKEWSAKYKELNDELETQLDELKTGFKDLTPAAFADTVMRAVVKDLADEHLSSVTRVVRDLVNQKMSDPLFAQSYVPRVYNRAKIDADNGVGLTRAIQQEFLKMKMTPEDAHLRAVEAVNRIRRFHTANDPSGTASVSKAGPQIERELAVSDEVIEPWLISDIDANATRYLRTVGSRLELARISADRGEPGAWRLTGDMNDIRQRYAEAINAADPATAKKLIKERDQGLLDIAAGRDRILGTYDIPSTFSPSWLTKLATVFRDSNFLARMGGITLASIPDVIQGAAAIGTARYFGKAGAALMRGAMPTLLKMSKVQLRKAGTIGDLLQPLMSHVPADESEVFMPRLQAVTRTFAQATGMPLYTTYTKAFSGVMLQDAMLAFSQRLSPKLKAGAEIKGRDFGAMSDLARFGIDESMIHQLANAPTTSHGGIQLLDAEKWGQTNPMALRDYQNSLVRAIDAVHNQPGAGDKFRWVKGPGLNLITQFKSFTITAHNNTLIPLLQDPAKLRAIGFMGASVMGGYMTMAIRDVIQGRGQMQAALDNGDYVGLAMKALSNTSTTTLLSEGLSMLPDVTGDSGYGRYPHDIATTLGGPTAGAINDIGQISRGLVSGAEQGYVTPGTAQKIRNMIPFNNLPLIAPGIDYGMQQMRE